MLKVFGVELLSIGAIGGILLGHPEHVQTLTAAVRESRPMSGWS